MVCLNILYKCYLFLQKPLRNKPKELIFVQKVLPIEIGYQMFLINQWDQSQVLTHLEGLEKRRNLLTKEKIFRIDPVKEKAWLRPTKTKVKTYKIKQNQESIYFVLETMMFICLLNTLMKKCANKYWTEKFRIWSSAPRLVIIRNS